MAKRLKKNILVNRRNYDRRLVVVFSDTHAGHEMGLLNPDTKTLAEVPVINESGEKSIDLDYIPVTPNPIQKALWEVYTKHIQQTFEIAGGDPVAVFHNGDITQGMKYLDGLMSNDLSLQVFVGASNMRPWFEHPNLTHFRIVWGTASHIFNGSSPKLVESLLKTAYPKVDIRSVKHSLADYGGVKFDIAHHGPPPGSRSWLTGNVVRYYTRSLYFDCLEGGAQIPDVIVRGHYHARVEETLTEFPKGNRKKIITLITPSYQGMNEYARQATRSKAKVLNGHAAIEIINGKVYDIHWLVDVTDVRQIEVLK